MADRYWVLGTGNWNSTANWSTTSGGAGGASVPTASDNAYFDGLSDRQASKSVTSITRSGTTATVTSTAHGYSNGDTVTIYGADQTEYNGTFTISNKTNDTFDITVSGSPATPATGTITCAKRAVFTVTVNVASTCNDLIIGDGSTITALNQTMTFAGSSTLAISGSLFFPATKLSRTYNGLVTFNATTTGKTITTNGIAPTGAVEINTAITFNGAGGEWTLQSSLSSNAAIVLSAGTLKTNNFNISASRFQSNGSGVRGLYLGSSTITTFSYYGSPVYFESTNLTFDAGTSKISMNSGASFNTSINDGWFRGGGLTFYNFEITNTSFSNAPVIDGANTFNNFTIVTQSAGNICNLYFNANQTITGSFNIQPGNTAANRKVIVRSYTSGTQRTITAATLGVGAGTEFLDINADGTAAPWNFSSVAVGNAGNNSNITFPAAKTVYWNLAGNKNWSDTGWATTSTGTPSDANFPLAQDTAVITEAGAAGTITMNAGWNLGTLTTDNGISPRTSAVTISFSSAPNIFGNIKLSSGVVISGAFNMVGRITQNITSAGKTLGSMTINSPGGTVVLQDNVTLGSGSTLTISTGTLNLNNKIFSCGIFGGAGGNSSIIFGSSKIQITGNNTRVINLNYGGGFTFSGTGLFECTYSGSVGTREFGLSQSDQSGSSAQAISITVLSGVDTISFSQGANTYIGSLIFENFAGTLSANAVTYSAFTYGDLKFSSGMTVNLPTVFTFNFASSFAQTLTSNGKIPNCSFTKSGSGTLTIVDNFTLNSARTFSHSNGTLDLNGKILTVGTYSSGGGNLNFGSGQMFVTGTGSCFAKSGGTVTPGTGKIVLSDNSNTARTFAGGGILTYPEVEIAGDTGTSTTTFTGANGFAKLSSTKQVAYTIVFPNATTRVANWNINGSSGNLVTLSRTGGSGTFTIQYTGGQYGVGRYLSISNSAATPANRMFAVNSTDGGSNTGWIFDAPRFGKFFSFFDVV